MGAALLPYATAEAFLRVNSLVRSHLACQRRRRWRPITISKNYIALVTWLDGQSFRQWLASHAVHL
ncbi:MAG: hypothetical protein NZ611_02355, partial [Bacteroidia bacterium]|nr:hypothetical protein [Bacteroidia bacterium]